MYYASVESGAKFDEILAFMKNAKVCTPQNYPLAIHAVSKARTACCNISCFTSINNKLLERNLEQLIASYIA